MSQQIPSEPHPARSRIDHLVNLAQFYNTIKRCRCSFGIAVGAAVLGNSVELPPLRKGTWNWSGEWWLRPEPWWSLGSVLLVSCESYLAYMLSLIYGTSLPLLHFSSRPSETRFYREILKP